MTAQSETAVTGYMLTWAVTIIPYINVLSNEQNGKKIHNMSSQGRILESLFLCSFSSVFFRGQSLPCTPQAPL